MLGVVATDLDGVYSEIDPSIPVLILLGTEDTDTLNENLEELRELFLVADDSYITYEGVGRNIRFEIPEESSRDILEWLENGSL